MLCHGVPGRTVIDYIFTFCNDILFYSLICNHLFYHGVLNEQRLSHNIPLNDQIFLPVFFWPIRSKCDVLMGAIPSCLLPLGLFKYSCEAIHFSVHDHRIALDLKQIEATTTRKYSVNLAFLFPRSHTTFSYTFSFVILRECCFCWKLLSWNESLLIRVTFSTTKKRLSFESRLAED